MEKPIRVLQVFAQMNRGGAETMLMNLYRSIDHSKVQFDFVVHTSGKCAFDDEIHELGGNIYRVPAYKGRNHVVYRKTWENFFIKHPEHKIIHGHVRSTASIYLKIAKKHGLITIAHSHSTSSGTGLSSFVKNVFQYPIRYIADYFFACSKSAGEWLFGNKTCTREAFFIIKNAIDSKKYFYNEKVRIKKRKEFKVENKFVIGHVGRFDKGKNHNFLIDIFKSVHDKNVNSVLLLVGDGKLRQQIEKKVNKFGLTNSVIFAGIRSDVPELLQAMDIFVFPSLYEGLPVTVVEAQAAGLKVVSANTITEEAKLSDLVKFVSLTEPVTYWAEKVFQYANGYDRKNTYNEICAAGYDVVENAKWLEKFYLELEN